MNPLESAPELLLLMYLRVLNVIHIKNADDHLTHYMTSPHLF